MARRALSAVIVIAIAILSRRADASCTEEAAELRDALRDEAHRARVWDVAWAVGFGVAAAGSVVLVATETKPFGTFDEDYRELLLVGAAKAAIGMASHLVLPLKITVPEPVSDPCTDVVALRAALAEAAKRERRSFYLNHLGGLAMHLVGIAVLAERRS